MTPPDALHPLLRICVRDFALVVLIGAALAAPVVTILEWQEERALARPSSHTIEATLVRGPSDHDSLRRWLETRDDTRDVEITETADGIRITLQSRADRPWKPPWEELGYECSGVSSSVIGNIVFRYGWGYHLFVLARTSTFGALFIGWRRRRQWSADSRRAKVSLPRSLVIGTAGGLGVAAILGGVFSLFAATGLPAGLFGVWSLISLWSPPAQIFGCIAGPIAFAIAAEWFYRGWIQESFLRAGHPRAGAILSTGLFLLSQAAIGLSLIAPLLVSIAAVVIYRRTRSLPAVITAHAIVLAAILIGSSLAGSPLSAL